MTYNEFKNKYNGKYVDVDNYPSNWKYQCFDLVQLYITQCLGLPKTILAGCGNVKNMLREPKLSLLKKYFDEVPLTAMYPGDICIWSSNHIAIFDHWDGRSNWYFSQNPNRCQVMRINMSGLHAFRKKNSTVNVISYYPKYNGNSSSIVDALKSLNINSTFANRKQIAIKNGISNYTGTASQNITLLNLLKQGKLKK